MSRNPNLAALSKTGAKSFGNPVCSRLSVPTPMMMSRYGSECVRWSRAESMERSRLKHMMNEHFKLNDSASST